MTHSAYDTILRRRVITNLENYLIMSSEQTVGISKLYFNPAIRYETGFSSRAGKVAVSNNRGNQTKCVFIVEP